MSDRSPLRGISREALAILLARLAHSIDPATQVRLARLERGFDEVRACVNEHELARPVKEAK